jgi:hypothetical protein
VLDGAPDDGEACQAQDAVFVDIIGRQADNKDCVDGPIFHQASDLLIVIGEKDVLPALEMGIRFLQVGQCGIIWSHAKFAYGPATRKHLDYELPPNSNVSYQVTLKSIVSPQEYSTAKFQLNLGLSRKQLGNDMYENEWSNGMGKQRSLRLYQKIAADMDRLIDSMDGEEIETDQAHALMIDCLNNVTAVHMRSKSYHAAKEAAVKVLIRDPNNFKGLIRAARAAMDDPAGSFEEAEAAIAAAENVNADDVTVKKLRMDVRRRKQEYKQKSKEMFSNFWSQNDVPDPKTAKTDELNSAGQRELKSPSDGVETEKEVLRVTTAAVWMKTLAPYAIQILLPFVIYALIMLFSKPQDGATGSDSASSQILLIPSKSS